MPQSTGFGSIDRPIESQTSVIDRAELLKHEKQRLDKARSYDTLAQAQLPLLGSVASMSIASVGMKPKLEASDNPEMKKLQTDIAAKHDEITKSLNDTKALLAKSRSMSEMIQVLVALYKVSNQLSEQRAVDANDSIENNRRERKDAIQVRNEKQEGLRGRVKISKDLEIASYTTMALSIIAAIVAAIFTFGVGGVAIGAGAAANLTTFASLSKGVGAVASIVGATTQGASAGLEHQGNLDKADLVETKHEQDQSQVQFRTDLTDQEADYRKSLKAFENVAALLKGIHDTIKTIMQQ